MNVSGLSQQELSEARKALDAVVAKIDPNVNPEEAIEASVTLTLGAYHLTRHMGDALVMAGMTHAYGSIIAQLTPEHTDELIQVLRVIVEAAKSMPEATADALMGGVQFGGFRIVEIPLDTDQGEA